MKVPQVIFVVIFLIISTSASHYRGGSLSWSIDERTINESSSTVVVRITQRHSYRTTFSVNTHCNETTIANEDRIGDGIVSCLGNCSEILPVIYSIPTFNTNVPCTDFSDEFDYSSGEGTVDVVVPKDVRFTYVSQSCCWINLLDGGNDWSLALVVDTHRRRNGKYNNSPKTSSSPVVQVQIGQTHVIPIPMADSDGDALRCRWGNTPAECGGICHPKGTLQSFPCQLTYDATALGYEGVALVIEDYDRITNQSYSSIPLQFLIHIVDRTQITVPSTLNYTGPPILPACTVSPVYVGDRHHGACIGIASNATVTERVVFKVPCNDSRTTITDILTVSPPGMTKSAISIDPNDNNVYIMYIQWTPRPDQYGIHQLCLAPVDSAGQTGQQVCYTFQVDVAPPQFVGESITPRGLVPRNQAIWSILTNQHVVPPIQRTPYIRYFKRVLNGTDEEVLRVNTATNVIYQTTQLIINTSNTTWEEGAHYYILFDSGVVSLNQSCGIESASIMDKHFWEFWIESVTTPIATTSPIVTTTTIPMTTTTTTKPTTRAVNSNNYCPRWLPFGTVVNLTSSVLEPNYTFCFTVNTTFADVTIVANTWASCSTWKMSGTADPLLELFTPETNTDSPVAQNDDGISISHLNCYAAALSYRLTKGNHRVVIRHPKCAYGNFELRLSNEITNTFK